METEHSQILTWICARFNEKSFFSWKCIDHIFLYSCQPVYYTVTTGQTAHFNRRRLPTEGHSQFCKPSEEAETDQWQNLPKDKTRERAFECLTCVHCMPCMTTKFGSDVHINVCPTWNAFILPSISDGSGPLLKKCCSINGTVHKILAEYLHLLTVV